METTVPAPNRGEFIDPQVRNPRHRLGAFGELAARRTLEEQGLTVVACRARTRAGEVDLVALDGDLVVFIEVKTRATVEFGRPAESVTPRKQARVARAALGFLQRRDWLERPCRFDVVEVICDPDLGGTEINHIIDAFRPRR